MSSTNEEKKLQFTFSKVKKSTNLSTQATSAKLAFETKQTVTSFKSKHRHSSDDDDKSEDEKDFLTEIENKKLKSTNSAKNVEKKAPIIPLISSKRSAEDMSAIKALIEDAKQNKGERVKNENLKIEMKDEDEDAKAVVISEPNYEEVNIEDFGLACLKGMGWSEKDGIGKTNKKVVKLTDIEVRPRGLGLGASWSTKKSNGEANGTSRNDDDGLSYIKGAYLQIINGKHDSEYAQLVSFDDGLNRILVKLANSNETVSVLQTCTRLVTRSEYDKRMSYKK